MASSIYEFLAWPGPVFLILGIILGSVFGALPGLGSVQAIALLLPVVYGMEPRLAMVMLVGVMGSTPFAGSISSILINTPGTSVNAATLLDGYPLTRQGKAGMALGASSVASGLGGVFGAIILLAIIPLGAKIILVFSFPEIFWLGIMGILTIAVVARGNTMKGLFAAGLGLMFSFVGFDPVTGAIRLSFGIPYLWDGIKIVPALIGIFALPEAIEVLVKRGDSTSRADMQIDNISHDVMEGVRAVFKNFGLLIRCSFIGTIVGIIPGIGGGVAAWIAYGHAYQSTKDKSKFGLGEIRGVIGPESANNAKEGGALIPTMLFGIPGSVEMAVFLSALMFLGLTPGPKMLIDNINIMYIIVITLIAASIIPSIFGLFAAKYIAKLTTVPVTILSPIIFTICLLGSYATEGNLKDVLVAFLFGILGYAMKEYGFSRVPMVIALVLGEIVEENFHLTIATMGWSGFIARPISAILFITLILMILSPVAKRKKGGANSEIKG